MMGSGNMEQYRESCLIYLYIRHVPDVGCNPWISHALTSQGVVMNIRILISTLQVVVLDLMATKVEIDEGVMSYEASVEGRPRSWHTSLARVVIRLSPHT